ncbi:LacI family transcriptional regulator [Nicoliella spurrieriana]|uniref:LacI family transcriptional regulator n=1 Tax=Nicoliella spurrieriana TaxID=2925830 RepID=A0A976X5C3_9LACO|nr:LacI family DNA-binding transcriptional regulator [Nicoliella spurrieriana]UQS86521.1 LacI family transcriptional regulator [Nicoliella spurrieriana]
MKKAITIQDIANLTGFSKSTVSRALNNDSRISQATHTLIHTVARDNHYRPNLIARSIKTNHTQIIGVIIPTFENQFFAKILETIQTRAAKVNYQVIVATTGERSSNEINAVEAMRTQMVEGIIIASTGKINHYRHLIGETPVVFIDRPVNRTEAHFFDSVLVDNCTGSYNVVSQLIKNGVERIGIIGNQLFEHRSQRLSGYRKALLAHQITFDADIVKFCHGDYHDAKQLASQLIINQACDGIYATDNTILSAILNEVEVQKLTSIQIGTFDDNPYLSLLNLPVVANQQPASEMGAKSFLMLFDQINGKHKSTSHLKLKTTVKTYL